MAQTVRYGLIGCGMMGHEHLRNIALLPDAVVTAIYEPDKGMAESARALVPEAQFAGDLSSFLDIEDMDALVIVSPNHCHADQLEAIAARRTLPILVEKPLFTDPADVQRIERFMASYQAPVWVAMEYRYMPPIAALLERADQTTGGVKMLTIREHRFPFLPKIGNWNRFNRNSGGTLVEKCCHFFDLMRLITKAEPVRIMASAGQDVNHLDERYDGAVPDIWDAGYVIVDFDNGARAMLELCMYAEGSLYQEEISAVGPNGKIEALVPGPTRFWNKELGEPPVPKLVLSPRRPKGPIVQDVPVDETLLAAGDHHGSTYYQHVAFHAVVRGQGAVEVSLNDGMKAVMMGQAAQKSAQTCQTVML